MAVSPARSVAKTPARRPYEQIVIEDVHPSIDNGLHPIKAVVGDRLVVAATVFRHGHEHLRVVARWYGPGDRTPADLPMTLVNPGLDRWEADVTLRDIGRHHFTIVAWTDRYTSWLEELRKRVEASEPDTASEVAEGLALVTRVAGGRKRAGADQAKALLARMREAATDPPRLLAVASEPSAVALMLTLGPRDDETRFERDLGVIADRERARFGAWYELFIRSQSAVPGQPATFADAAARLPAIRAMGFDVVYLAPIHPIGTTNRKGRNNRVGAGPDDPGSPWAIGSAAGGHTAVEPALGTLDDFGAFVRDARALGMEVALDLAIQCSPDHPWVREHPEWFYRRPDGTIRYAENPPKKYQDIYPVNFETPDWRGLWEALYEVVVFWIARDVRIFRVDNPHTKPIGFWSWLIDRVQVEHPDVIFLAEAFTRPPMMQALAKRGFTQSYTYFTWRTSKAELTAYMTELTQSAAAAAFRPNFFANTPDILPWILQQGGPPAFTSRLVLAATLSPSYGIYSGFELCEAEAIPGREEYLHSEKYEIKTRDWQAPGNLIDLVTAVNAARRENPALRQLTDLAFLETENEHLIAYVKATPDRTNAVIVVVNLDPFSAREGFVTVPPDAIGVAPGAAYDVVDVVDGGRRYAWGDRNFVRLDPAAMSAHVFRVERRP